MSRLSEMARGRLRTYIFRVTLDDELTSDLVQETLLQMVKSLNGLQKPESFWSWLYRIAMNKIQQYYRQLVSRKTQPASVFTGDILGEQAGHSGLEGVRKLERKELSHNVITAMEKLKQRDRAVISLRCFDEMSFSEIAAVMDCSEINARLRFFRAKAALKRQLARFGIGRSSLLLALGLFGKLTASGEAAATQGAVSAATVKVGVGTVLACYVGTKLGIVITSAIIFAAAVAGTAVMLKEDAPGLKREKVASFHYTLQSRNNNPGAVASLSKGAYEQWFYFPEGIDGPMFRRMQRWTPDQKGKLCTWLQNEEGNYYYHSGERQVYINNYHLWQSSMRTMQLPSDPPEFVQFLNQVEGVVEGVQHRRDRNGLLAETIDRRFADASNYHTEYSYNTLEESFFDYIWSMDIPINDERDEMHRRGWTYYEISGEVNGQSITGGGIVPFTCKTAREHPACIHLHVGDEWYYVDTQQGAYVCRAEGDCVARYASGAFMKGWMRPWMGLHAVDIVRRDATEEHMQFETILSDEGDFAEIIIHDHHSDIRLRYSVDMEKDRIDWIQMESLVKERAGGIIQFHYCDDIRSLQEELMEPPTPEGTAAISVLENDGIRWISQLSAIQK